MKKSHMIAITTLTTASALILGVAAYAQGHGQGPMGGPGERPAFATLDADGDGNITIAEMKAHAETQFGERDTNGDGVLSSDELVASIAARAAERAAANVDRMIQWRDTDGDGALSASELGGDNGQRMFAMADANEDGMISAEEFDALGAKMRGKGRFAERGERDGHGRHGDHDRKGMNRQGG